jgi:Asp-tRNA(Asn)/Glu-tRNA(Gln) amidotransferase A subunit family amidase
MNQPSKILSLTALGQQLRSGAITCRELIESQLAKVQRSNSSIDALVSTESCKIGNR